MLGLRLPERCCLTVNPPFQVSGPYLTQYEVYYKRLDPESKGEIGAMDAAKFLKNSGLADEFLGKVSVMLEKGVGACNLSECEEDVDGAIRKTSAKGELILNWESVSYWILETLL